MDTFGKGFDNTVRVWAKANNVPYQKARQYAVRKLAGSKRAGNSTVRSLATKLSNMTPLKHSRESPAMSRKDFALDSANCVRRQPYEHLDRWGAKE